MKLNTRRHNDPIKKKKKKWAKQLNRVVSKGDMQMSNNHVKGC